MKAFTIPVRDSIQASRNQIDWFDVSIRVIIYSLTSIAIYGYYPRLTQLFEQQIFVKPSHATVIQNNTSASKMAVPSVVQPMQPAIAPFDALSFKTKHPLTGVFISNSETLAMINNQFFHIDEKIDNMKIIQITLEGVTLSNEKEYVFLKIV